MSGIVALGRHAGPFLDQPVHAVHVDPAQVADLPAAFDLVRAQLHAVGPTLVVYPAGMGDATARMLSTIRSSLPGAPLLWHATTLPPLAADVLVTLAAALQRPLGGPVLVAAALPLLEAQLVRVTWVPSVARLRDPAPSVWQHARSSIPGTSWLVTSWPEAAVHRLDPSALPALPRPSQQVGVAVADLDGDLSWVTPMAAQLPDAVGVQVPPPADSSSWWGCRRVVQAVVYPRSLDLLADALRVRLDPGTCSWCRRAVGSTTCPWCDLPRNGLTRQVAPDQPRHEEDLLGAGPPQEVVPR